MITSARIEQRANANYKNDYTYTGKELDDESGLYYYEARYYDAEIGRFTSVDPWFGDISDPQSLNKYAYVRNNPIIYVDPSGEVFWMAALPIAAGIVGFFAAPQHLNAPGENTEITHARSEAETIVAIADKVSSTLNLAKGALNAGRGAVNVLTTALSGRQNQSRQKKISQQQQSVSNLLSKTRIEKKDKSTIRSIDGGWKDANKEFNILTKDVKVKTTVIKGKGILKTATLEDGTTVSLRNFHTQEKNAAATIQVTQRNQNGKTKTNKIRFMNNPSDGDE